MAYTDVVLADSPVSYWRLDEPSGTLVDGPGVNDGTQFGGVTYGAQGLLAGDGNTALSFDGSDDRVEVATASSLNVTSITLEAWIKTTAGGRIISRQDGVQSSYYLAAFGDGYLILGVQIGGVAKFIANGPTTHPEFRDNQIHHIVGTYDGAFIRIYLDAVEVLPAVAQAGNIDSSTAPVQLGVLREAGANSGQFTGTIDEPAIYSTALSPARILAHYEAGKASLTAGAPTGRTPGLVGPGLESMLDALTGGHHLRLLGTSSYWLDLQPSTAVGAQLSAPVQVPLDATSATVTATLAVTAATQAPLDVVSAASSASLGLTAPALLSLATSAVATTSLAATAKTALPLSAPSAIASPTLVLTAQTVVALSASTATSSATAAVTAPAQVILASVSAVSSATLAVTAATQVPLQAADATATSTLALTAATGISLAASSASAAPTLALTAPTEVPLDAAVAQSSAAAALEAPAEVLLEASSATTTATANVTTPGAAVITPDPATATAGTSLSLTAPTSLPSDAASGMSSATLALNAPSLLTLTSTAIGSTSLVLTVPEQVFLTLSSSAVSSTTLALSIQTDVALGASSATSTASLDLTAPFFSVWTYGHTGGASYDGDDGWTYNLDDTGMASYR